MQSIILIIFVAVWILCRKESDGKGNLFGKPMRPFYQISAGIWKKCSRYFMKSDYVKKLREKLMLIHINVDGQELLKQYICHKTSFVLAMIFAATILSMVIVQQEKADETEVTELKKDGYWGEEKEEFLYMNVEGSDKKEEVTITVPEQKYDEKEIKKILGEMAGKVEQLILKDNQSLDQITSDLDLITEIPDTLITVSWSMDNEEYLDYSGKLLVDAVTKESVVVNLTATLTYEKEEYIHQFAVCIQKPEKNSSQQLKSILKQELERRTVSNPGAEVLSLPDKLQGKKVDFEYRKETYGNKIFWGFMICAVLVFFMKDEEIKKRMQEREQQMIIDYPDIVSKLTLLLGAGLTIRSALDKIAHDYEKKRIKGSVKSRFAYDEILFVCREMQGGISDRTGIDMLSNRCQIPCYMKLCTLLLQNLKKGSKGMAQILGYEVSQAFEERKNAARRFGEEAGTKLLFPMILMLVIVMVILIVPACLSF